MKTLSIVFFALWSISCFAQLDSKGPFIHSHNDYVQTEPLFGALKAGAKSIEIDVFLHHGELVVAHSNSEIKKENTLENLYIRPLTKYLAETKISHNFHFLIDIKSEAISTLSEIEKTLKKYPDLFYKGGIQVIISGNRPKAENYSNYAEFIWFDGREPADAKDSGGSRVAMISQNLSKYTRWRGDGKIPVDERNTLIDFITQCHAVNKPVRLWNTGDSEEIYHFLFAAGVDYLNTDNPKALQTFLKTLK